MDNKATYNWVLKADHIYTGDNSFVSSNPVEFNKVPLINGIPLAKSIFIEGTFTSTNVGVWVSSNPISIPAHQKFKVEVTLAADYIPIVGATTVGWMAFGIALLTDVQKFGETLGDPIVNNNYTVSITSIPFFPSGRFVNSPVSFLSDIFDLSNDDATSCNFQLIMRNVTSIITSSIRYTVLLTPLL